MPAGRFAPSPTGLLHVGNLRTALIAWLAARRDGSSFQLRSDDLDPAARPEIEARQLADLVAVGLDWDGPVVRQSQRRGLYDEAIDELVGRGVTYPCFCTRREIREATRAPHGEAVEGAYPGTCRDLTAAERADRAEAGRPPALRLRADDAKVGAVDQRLGRTIGVVDDIVLRRNDGLPAYNLTTVVDDAAMGVAEVVRAEDLWPSTPRQVYLASLLSLEPPLYLHVPLVVGADGERLAKRHGAITLADVLATGASPADLRSAMAASLGLAEPGQDAPLDVLVARFDPRHLPSAPWRYGA